MVRTIGVMLSLAVALTACTACPAAVRATQIVVDCTRQNQESISKLAHEFLPLLRLEEPDWPAVIAAAVAAGRDVGGCALAEAVDIYLGGLWELSPAPGTPAAVSASMAAATRVTRETIARQNFERYRSEFAPGVTFRTAQGDR